MKKDEEMLYELHRRIYNTQVLQVKGSMLTQCNIDYTIQYLISMKITSKYLLANTIYRTYIYKYIDILCRQNFHQ